jgi:hypothetical protein
MFSWAMIRSVCEQFHSLGTGLRIESEQVRLGARTVCVDSFAVDPAQWRTVRATGGGVYDQDGADSSAQRFGKRDDARPANFQSKPREERPATFDPDSPFAKLAALRDLLKK